MTPAWARPCIYAARINRSCIPSSAPRGMKWGSVAKRVVYMQQPEYTPSPSPLSATPMSVTAYSASHFAGAAICQAWGQSDAHQEAR